MTDFAHARKVMVDNQLRTSGVTDRRLLGAMGAVPREEFVPASRKALAYIDEAQPLEGGRKLGAPAPFARLVQLAQIEHSDRVLDLGCATGYSAAVLGAVAANVVAVEPEPHLAARARATLSDLGVANVTVVDGPIETAGNGRGPFDVIVIEGVLAEVPETLFTQLKPNGRLVALVSSRGRPPVAHLYAKSGERVAAQAAFDARLPPLAALDDDRFVF